MNQTGKTIKYLAGVLIFSLGFIFEITIASAAYSANTLISLTNSARTQDGLGALATNSSLSSAAYAKAQDILAEGYFAHNAPSGKTPWDFINESGYNYAYAGENLAIGYNDASELFTAWMNSPTHRENILNPNYREIGIAVVSGTFQGTETIVAVQEFGASTSSAAPTAPTEVAAENTTPAVGNSPTPTTTVQKSFEFQKDKSDFLPKSIFAGEAVEFKVTISGEVKTLEAQAFGKKYNLLETGSVTGSGKEKTYVLKQKIEDLGSSEVKIVATDQNGNSDILNLGTLEVKATVIAKNQNENQNQASLFAGFKESFKDNWVIYASAIGLMILVVGFYFINKKSKFGNLVASWRF